MLQITRRVRNPEKGNKLLYIVEFPKVISYLLRYLYKIRFGSKVSRLPKTFFSLSNFLKFEIIKAFADDESRVGESRITFISSNKFLLSDLKRMITQSLDLNSKDFSDVFYVSSSKVYNFEFRRNTLNTFYKFINYNHRKKKDLLKSIINRGSTPGNKYREGEAQKLILGMISKKPRTAIELSSKLGIKANNVRYHLYKLKQMSKVIDTSGGQYHTTIWGINNVKKNTLYE